ncbi:cyclic nucleotide-binding protein [Roseobacter sp. GAI101]|nr:cyclic nucleotide-binding protein [Roseobacter sp. GAI101]
MERSLFSFIWRHSKRDQIVLAVVTLMLFPLLYVTLELPKRIINDAIGAASNRVTVFGVELAQTTFLLILCFGFLGFVILYGVMKMRVNTMKGVLAERLLRRFRFALIGRILRFPRAYQQQTSEGELVAALTAEAEPLGGIMGDAIATPLLQAGQMLTILLFLFLQNFWFGVAAMAMFPVQVWLIPQMQKRINVLNRSRVRQVRSLAAEVGEITTGAATLRQHGGWTARMATVSARLGRLFNTRFDIYRKKFFMKFVNNLLTQITPFFFFLVGGLLVINGSLTIGALVASLAAFKDLSAPWKELLTYYTTVQEVSQRYHMIVERFDPPDMLADFLAESPYDVAEQPMAGTVSLSNVIVQDDMGRQLLSGASLEVAAGDWLCIAAPEDEDRAMLAELLLRDIAPASGQVKIGGHDLTTIGQHHIARMIGHANATPYIFRGTVGDNVMVPLTMAPALHLSEADLHEAQRSGNMLGLTAPPHPTDAQLASARHDWQLLVSAIGAQKSLLSKALDRFLAHPEDSILQDQLTALRSTIPAQIDGLNLKDAIDSFSDDIYFDDLTLAENLLMALKAKEDWIGPRSTQKLRDLLVALDLLDLVIDQSLTLAKTLVESFDSDTTGSVLFRRLGIPGDILPQLQKVIEQTKITGETLKFADETLLLSLQFNVPARAFDRAFTKKVKNAIIAARPKVKTLADPSLANRYLPLQADHWNERLNVLENLVFGKVTPEGRQNMEQIRDQVVDALVAGVAEDALFDLIQRLPTGLRGANLSAQIAEHISLAQVVVKRPGIVILDRAMASFPDPVRHASFALLRKILPDATILQLEAALPEDGPHDNQLELRQGRLIAVGQDTDHAPDSSETSDLHKKRSALRKAPLFRELSRSQLRLLAFSARWVDIEPGQIVFRKNDLPDGAYLIYSGAIELYDEDETGTVTFSVIPPPGTLVGEVGLIRNDPRRLSMRAQSPVTLLRIDPEDFLSIIESDARTAFKLIQYLVGYIGTGK